MKSGLETMRGFSLVIGGLILAAVACGPLAPGPDPTRTPTLTAVLPTETSTVTPTASPAPTETLIPTATAIPTTATPPSAVCPPSGSPELAQPASFGDYPDAIQTYLSAGGDLKALRAKLIEWHALPNGANQVIAADLNGDGADEVVLTVVDPQGQAIAPSGILLVFQCSGGAYVLRYREGSGESEAFEPSTEILDVDDLTLDDLPDVIYVLRTCGAHTCYERLRVLGWDGDQLVNLMGGTLELPYPTYTVEPGHIEAISGGIGSVGAEPQRGYKEIWRWDGQIFTRTRTVYQPPVYRYHALLDGDRALGSGDHVTATAIYKRVINDDALKEWGSVSGMMTPAEERAQLSAFARWRLVLTYLLMDRPDDAQLAYDRLQQEYTEDPGRDVAQMAESFWMVYQRSGSVPEGCAAIRAEVEPYLPVLEFFNRNYGYANPHWEPKDLCPF